ncbi:MAG: class I SAM-dependent methyltransferase [Pseudonocardiaceae bacterium]
MSTAAIDWDATYRSGRHLRYWELSRPSPELVGFVGGWLASQPAAHRRVLDLGCGSGQDSVFLAQHGCITSAIDISTEAVALTRDHAKEHGVEVDVEVGDALALPYPDRTFDLVTDRGCFHHVEREQRRRYAVEVARVLKPGGLLHLRGCCVPRFPFVPMPEDEVRATFGAPDFDVLLVTPLDLVTDQNVIAGNACTIARH